MVKFFYNNIEVNLLTNSLKVFTKLYGCSTQLYLYILTRFELIPSINLQRNQITLLYIFLLQFIPNIISIKMIYIHNLLLLDKSLSYKTFRHLFNLPVNGQRT